MRTNNIKYWESNVEKIDATGCSSRNPFQESIFLRNRNDISMRAFEAREEFHLIGYVPNNAFGRYYDEEKNITLNPKSLLISTDVRDFDSSGIDSRTEIFTSETKYIRDRFPSVTITEINDTAHFSSTTADGDYLRVLHLHFKPTEKYDIDMFIQDAQYLFPYNKDYGEHEHAEKIRVRETEPENPPVKVEPNYAQPWIHPYFSPEAEYDFFYALTGKDPAQLTKIYEAYKDNPYFVSALILNPATPDRVLEDIVKNNPNKELRDMAEKELAKRARERRFNRDIPDYTKEEKKDFDNDPEPELDF